jgi:hypothetical protein
MKNKKNRSNKNITNKTKVIKNKPNNRSKKHNDEVSLKEISTFMLVFSIMLFAGWFFMMSGVDAEYEQGISEYILEEPYFSWIHWFSTAYWVIGTGAVICGGIFAKLPDKYEWMKIIPFIIGIMLFGLALTIDFLIALIKLNAPQYAVLFGCVILLIAVVETVLFFLKINDLDQVRNWSLLLLGILAAFLISTADPIAGNIIVKWKNDIIDGFWAKSIYWGIGLVGSGIFIGVYNFFLRELRGSKE